jgi:Family of unknown function (DUF5686)/CarboxypepD_reg-like domain
MKQIIFLLLFFSLAIQAQVQISGTVQDAQTKKPLPFATIYLNSTRKIIADVEGKFSVSVEQNPYLISFSYMGFESKTIAINQYKSFYLIQLEPISNQLNEITIQNKDNALSIIKKTIENRNFNNPEKKLNSFQFKTYNKLIVSANPDSISGKIDSVLIKKRSKKLILKLDSTDFKFKKIVTKQHFFQTEKVSQFQFSDKKLKETILGTKMSGFKTPIYEILGFNLQSFSIYDNEYELFESKYDSPISKNAIQNYTYKVLDTVEIDNRKTIVLYFKNKRKQFGLEGALYIDATSFAIAKAIMRTKGVLDISGTHDFLYNEKQDVWFPSSTIFKIIKGKNDDDIKIFGGTIKFDGDVEKDFKPRKKQASDFVYLSSVTKNFDYEYNIPFKIKKSFIAIDINENAINKPDSFWEYYRKDSLDSRSQKTYMSLDSISIKNKLENRIVLGRKIIKGFFPVSFIDLDLRKLFNYNNYEGFRFCLAGVTGERFSKKYKIESYTAYGTKDGVFKYNLGLSARVGKNSNSWVGVSYTNDVQEIASTTFEIDKNQFKLIDTSLLNFSSFYNYRTWKASIETKILPKTESIWEISHAMIEPKFDYFYKINNTFYTKFNLTAAIISLNWNPFSRFMQTPTGKIEIDTKFPKFTFQVMKSLPKIWNNDFDFGRINLKVNYEKKYLNGQNTKFMLAFGYAFGDIPITHLFNNSPNSLNKDKLLQRTTIEGDNDFETMYFNEFFSNKFAFFQIKHSFNRIKISKKFSPSFMLVTRMGFGSLQNKERHLGFDFKTLEKGYFESGVELNQIYKGIGICGFYRYGPNKLPDFEDNVAFRISYILDLGF